MNQDKFELDTPCLVIDKTKLLENLQRMQQDVTLAGKNLRPHIKTHKCTTLAKLQIQQGAIGVCAAKVSEAEVLVNAGITGVLITSPVVTQTKIQKLMACAQKDSTLMVVTDSADNVRQLNAAAQLANLTLNVLVDVNPTIGRTGISYSNALMLAQLIHAQPYLSLQGIQCYAGNLQHISEYEARKKASQDVMRQAATLVTQFKQAGLPCPILTGSGTGTYDIDSELDAVTEVQPGSYTVMDREYQLIGSEQDPQHFQRFKAAMTMLLTVISANHPTHVTVDGGTKSLYVDAHTKPKIISHPGLHYDWGGFGDEQGKITADPGIALPKVGDLLELIVPHCDPTINLFDVFYITERDRVVDQWTIDMRGKSQ